VAEGQGNRALVVNSLQYLSSKKGGMMEVNEVRASAQKAIHESGFRCQAAVIVVGWEMELPDCERVRVSFPTSGEELVKLIDDSGFQSTFGSYDDLKKEQIRKKVYWISFLVRAKGSTEELVKKEALEKIEEALHKKKDDLISSWLEPLGDD